MQTLWYSCSTPSAVMKALQIPRLDLVKPILDIAVQVSFTHGLEGRIMLHADPKGFYLPKLYSDAGLINISASANLSSWGRRNSNDGRYYKFDNAQALALDTELVYFRK